MLRENVIGEARTGVGEDGYGMVGGRGEYVGDSRRRIGVAAVRWQAVVKVAGGRRRQAGGAAAWWSPRQVVRARWWRRERAAGER